MLSFWHQGQNSNKYAMGLSTYSLISPSIDCEQPLFFFRFSKGSARARERWAAKPQDARESLLSCLSRFAPSVTRVVICVSRAFCSTDQEKRETARSLVRLALACEQALPTPTRSPWRACSQGSLKTLQYYFLFNGAKWLIYKLFHYSNCLFLPYSAVSSGSVKHSHYRRNCNPSGAPNENIVQNHLT